MSPTLSRTALERRALALAELRRPHAMCTVVRVTRPASVHPGDAALVHPDGRIEGFVGGHCAADTIRLQALRAMETGVSTLVRIVPGPDDAPARDGTVTVANPCLSGGELEVFVEPRRPAPRILVVGDSPVGAAVCELGRGVGFDVDVVAVSGDVGAAVSQGDERESGAGGSELSAVVVAALGHGDEAGAVRTALDAGVPYVGLVASRRRGGALVEELMAAGVDRVALDRLRTPAGMDIGARTHAEIALSVLAEIIASGSGPKTCTPTSGSGPETCTHASGSGPKTCAPGEAGG